jgi:hypothetical protein
LLRKLQRAVRAIKRLAAQSGVLEENKKRDSDSQFLPLKTDAWLEALDPKHRYGGNLKLYFPSWRDSSTVDSFFDWLDKGEGKQMSLEELPREKLEKERVKYLTIFERQAYKAKPAGDGKLCYVQSGELVEGNMIFVMDVRGQLFIGPKVKGRFHHSSFLSGAGVLVAGSAQFKDGLFTSLRPHSGHYHPKPDHFDVFIANLREAGLCSENVDAIMSKRNNEGFGNKRDTSDNSQDLCRKHHRFATAGSSCD